MKKLYEEEDIQNLINATREKTGKTDKMTVSQVAEEINTIKNKAILEDITITENGSYKASEGFDGLGVVLVNVESKSEDSFSRLLIVDNQHFIENVILNDTVIFE